MDELRDDIVRYGPIERFFDATGVESAHVPVQEQWTEWLRTHRKALKHASFLVGGKYVQVTIEIARLFSRTGDLVRVYLDRAAFEDAIARAVRG